MSREAAREFLDILTDDVILLEDVLRGGAQRSERIAAMVELGGGEFSAEDMTSAFAEIGLVDSGATATLSRAEAANSNRNEDEYETLDRAS